MSPYSGIEPGSEEEKAVESCVEKVMTENADMEKSAAIGICRKQLKASEEVKGIELTPVTATDYTNLFFGGEADKTQLMRFDNALLCRAGTNRNNDKIDELGIEQLAESIRFMPVVDEHQAQVVVGFMLDGRAVSKSTELRGSGILFSGRWPQVTAAVQDGTKRISIEAVAEEARCEECGGVYANTSEYCDHLKSKTATRWLSGLKARGIATVEHPAWETSFDKNGFVMIASELDCTESEVKEPTWLQGFKAWVEDKLSPVVEDATVIVAEVISKGGTKMFEIVDGETLEELKSRLELVAASELEQAVNAKEVELKAAFEASETELKSEFESREIELKAETDKVKLGFERALELGMNSEQATILASLEEDAYALFKKQQEEVEVQASTGEEEPEAGQLKGQVLSTTENVDKPLTLQNMGEFLSGRIKGGK